MFAGLCVRLKMVPPNASSALSSRSSLVLVKSGEESMSAGSGTDKHTLLPLQAPALQRPSSCSLRGRRRLHSCSTALGCLVSQLLGKLLGQRSWLPSLAAQRRCSYCSTVDGLFCTQKPLGCLASGWPSNHPPLLPPCAACPNSVWECWRLWGEVAHAADLGALQQLPASIQARAWGCAGLRWDDYCGWSRLLVDGEWMI